MYASVTAGFGVKIEWGFGLIFYLHSVIGRVVNFVDVIYGARTHSARHYVAYINI